MAQAENHSQYLSFQIAGEDYGVGILRIKEIIEFEALTVVPGTPPSIRGVINLRGSVVPVVDLAARFGLAPLVPGRRSCIVIVEASLQSQETVMGVLADAVSQVIELGAADIEPPPAFGTQVHVEYLKGMAIRGKKFVLLLDIDRVLSAADLLHPPQVRDSGVEPAAAEADSVAV